MHSELAYEMEITSLDASELQLAVVSYSDVADVWSVSPL